MVANSKWLYVLWHKWLLDIDRSETELAKELGLRQNNLNRAILSASIKVTTLNDILGHFGYTLSITKLTKGSR